MSISRLWERVESNRGDVTAVLVITGGQGGATTLTGAEAQDELDSMGRDLDGAWPFCESAGMVGIRQGAVYRLILFAGESVARAMAAMGGC